MAETYALGEVIKSVASGAELVRVCCRTGITSGLSAS